MPLFLNPNVLSPYSSPYDLIRYFPIVGPILLGRGGPGSASACDPRAMLAALMNFRLLPEEVQVWK